MPLPITKPFLGAFNISLGVESFEILEIPLVTVLIEIVETFEEVSGVYVRRESITDEGIVVVESKLDTKALGSIGIRTQERHVRVREMSVVLLVGRGSSQVPKAERGADGQ